MLHDNWRWKRTIPYIILATAAAGCADAESTDTGNTVCTEGVYSCDPSAGGEELKVCEGGEWKLMQTCAPTQKCDAQSGKCTEPASLACTEGQMQCSGNTLERCSAGVWAVNQACPAGTTCNAADGTCDKDSISAQCTSGKRKCEGQTPYLCENSQWKIQTSCSASQRCENGECVNICEPGTYQCDGKHLLKCDGGWTEVKLCGEDQTCSETAGDCLDQVTIICNEGQTDCIGNVPQICRSNAWQAQTACTESQTCSPVTGTCETNACTPGTASCSGNTLTWCDNSLQEQQKTCPAGTQCDANAADCIDPNANKCTIDGKIVDTGTAVCTADGKLASCSSGKVTEKACPSSSQICRKGESKCTDYKSCDSIPHGALTCKATGTVARCDDGTLKTEANCGSQQVCMQEGTLYICKDKPAQSCTYNKTTLNIGDAICSTDGKLLTCGTDGKMSAPQTCPAGTSQCRVNACVPADCGSLPSGAKTCSADGRQIATCTDGSLVSGTTCTSAQVCELSGTLPKCTEAPKTYTSINAIHTDYSKIVDSSTCKSTAASKSAKVNISKAVITAVLSDGIYIQDPSIPTAKNAGLFVSCKAPECTLPTVSVGKQVSVVSDGVGQENCELQIRPKTKATVSVSSGSTMSAVTVNVKDINSGAHNAYTGSLVTVSNIQITANDASILSAQDDAGNALKISKYLYSDLSLTKGFRYRVSGIVSYKNGSSVLMPRNNIDLSLIECSGSEMKCEANTEYTCSGGKWGTGKSCTTSDPNATAVCKGSACAAECKTGFEMVSGKCTAITVPKKDCTDNDKNTIESGKVSCSSASALATCNDGKWEKPQTCTAVAHSIATCKDGTCDWLCEAGYEKLGGSCVPKNCQDADKSEIANGSSGCKDANTQAMCKLGTWTDSISCKYGCDSTQRSCVPHPDVTWCIFQSSNASGTYSRLAPLSSEKASISASFRCTMDPTKPIREWNSFDAIPNKSCSSCSDNTEYMTSSETLPPEGLFTCVSVISVDDKTDYICPNYDIHEDKDKITVLSDDTFADASQTKNYSVRKLTWCQFVSRVNSTDASGGGIYVRIAPPADGTKFTAETRCIEEDVKKPILSWKSYSMERNMSCSGCGSNEEYMRVAELPDNSHTCATIFKTENGAYYACPTFDAGAASDKILMLDTVTVLPDGYFWKN